MATNLLAFYAACTALLLFVVGMLMVPLLRRGQRRTAPDSESAQVAVHRDQLREIKRDLAAGTLTETQFAAARSEIEMQFGEELVATAQGPAPTEAPDPQPRRAAFARNPVVVAAGVAVIVIGGAWAIYARLGDPLAINHDAAGPMKTADGASALRGAPLPSMETLTQRLALKMRTQTPDDGAGWALLARSYVELKQYREAADAFAEATKRLPDDATLLADYADALGMANGRTLRGEPAALAQRALKADPAHPKALALAASAAFADKKYGDAIGYWDRLRVILPPGSDDARGVEANIAEAQALLDGKVPVAASTAETSTSAAPAVPPDAGISGAVQLAPELTAKVTAGDTLFVYAQATNGPKMPIAIVRATGPTFPFEFHLDDSQGMLPGVRLSAQSQVTVTARVSHGGTATPQPGDLLGTVSPVKIGANDIDLKIDRIVR